MIKRYKDKAGGWRWRMVAKNGEIIADSGESYTRRKDVTRALCTFWEVAREDFKAFSGGLEL